MYYITISNGLLCPEHKKRMGSAVWEFMWCIDKVTRVDANGNGWVLGGKPIKLNEIGIGHDNTISRNLAKLEKQGYIATTRTPYGAVIKVMKAKKRFTKNSDSTEMVNHQKLESPTRNGESPTNNGESNKTVSVDKVIDKTTEASSVWVLEDKLREMEGSPNSYLDIIATFIREKPVAIQNSKQLSAVIQRYARVAKKLAGAYSNDQIFEAVKKIKDTNKKREGNEIDYTLETIYKQLTK